MELRQMQYVLQIAEEKNFSRAAEKLHIAQPSLSQQLSKLEKEIGLLLFQRSTNSVELTHAGEVFVARAQEIMDLVNQLNKELNDISDMKRGKLIIGSLPITGAHIFPLILPVYQAKYPDIEIGLVEDTTANLEQKTASGKTDLSLLTLPLLDPSSLQYQDLIEEEILLALPPNHPLAQQHANNGQPLPLELFKNEPFITLKRGQGFRKITLDLCKKAGFEPQIKFESTNIETVQSLVAAGMGIALVPKMIARTKWSHYVPNYIPIEGKPTRTIVVAYRKGRYMSKAAEAFIEVMKKSIASAKTF